jgi:mannose-6-phosphate isomerase|uniref:class I mannose-6-phosphate isomerase n=1 Tax=Cephaloticoccus sp. TaxID=1985742 RepID=UPI00404AFCE8
MSHHGKVILLPPNRVWRNYDGGRTLDQWAGATNPTDGPRPEDWIASTTRATNPGRESISEGVSQVELSGSKYDFVTLLASDPDYFLGSSHTARYGQQPQLLVKFLDPAIRLHLQVHPTADFAQRFLQSPSGKTEAYHVISIRDEVSEPVIYLGFQSPPTRDQLRTWIEHQAIDAILRSMNRIQVKPGDTYVVPGGVPHALGEGIFLVEIQEPSDLVVRFEFERGGRVLLEKARFMQRGLAFCLDVFDYSPWTANRISLEAGCTARRRRALGVDSWQDDLIGPERTPCFRVRQSTIRSAITKIEDSSYIAIVTAGRCTLRAGGETHQLGCCDKIFVPAGLGTLEIIPDPACTLLECYPPVV